MKVRDAPRQLRILGGDGRQARRELAAFGREPVPRAGGEAKDRGEQVARMEVAGDERLVDEHADGAGEKERHAELLPEQDAQILDGELIEVLRHELTASAHEEGLVRFGWAGSPSFEVGESHHGISLPCPRRPATVRHHARVTRKSLVIFQDHVVETLE